SSSPTKSRKTVVSSPIRASSKALRTSGRERTTRATGPRFSTRTRGMSSSLIADEIPRRLGTTRPTTSSASSHPEDADARLLHRRVVGRREPEREGRARLRRVEHAVVPDPGGRVVRVALPLVLLQRRPLELGNLLRSHERLAGPRQLLLLDGRED